MPTATAPLGKPAAAKPTGFTKPAGLSRQTPAAVKKDIVEEEETPGLQPVHIGISAVALILAALFMWTVYDGDQTPNRTSEYLFGAPGAEEQDATVSTDDSSDDEEDSEDGESGSDEEDEEE